jgi:flavin-dependent dehydrogenase
MVDGAERVDLPPKLPEHAVVNPHRVKGMDPDQRSGQEAFSGMLNEEKNKSEEDLKENDAEAEKKKKEALRLLEGIQDGVVLSKEAESLLSDESKTLPDKLIENKSALPQQSSRSEAEEKKPEVEEKKSDKDTSSPQNTGEGHINITV